MDVQVGEWQSGEVSGASGDLSRGGGRSVEVSECLKSTRMVSGGQGR